ncbi:MAG TPA: LCP family protein [Candidatus Blautia excrementipullorum]|nr:LCP family protein [Candidatus Blautia excrementipullorum]
MAKPRSKTKKILFAVEIIVLLLFIGGLYVYGQLNSKLDKVNQPVMDDSKIQVNQEVQDAIDSETSNLTGYTTYALFGIDHRDKNPALGTENSDTMIIASVNNDTKDVKLVSIYRDTLLNLGDGTYSKANAAYAYGGPEQAITMLNTNLDLNITDYATVNFDALATIVDCLGGLDMDMSYAEIVHMNNYCVETSEETGKDYTPIELPPEPEDIEKIDYRYHLNGVQVTSYCRIRYTASLDMGRTERQRKVIQMIVSKAKSAGLSTIFDIMDQVFPMVTTSLNKTEILQLLPTMIGYSMNDTVGFPTNYKFATVKGSVIVPTDLESNVIELHKFLYGDEDYTPSSTVKQNSQEILDIVGGTENLNDTQPVVTEDTENTGDDTIFFQNDGSGWADTTDQISDNSGGGEDPGYTDPGTGGGDSGYTDPGTGGEDPGYTDPGTGGGDPGYTDPGTGGEDPGYTDPGTGGEDPGYTDPGTGGEDPGYTDPGTGGGDPGYTDPGTGGGDSGYTDPGTGDAGVGDTGGDASGGGTVEAA